MQVIHAIAFLVQFIEGFLFVIEISGCQLNASIPLTPENIVIPYACISKLANGLAP